VNPIKILVCVKRVIDPNARVSVRADNSGMQLDGLRTALNPFDEVAVEEAVRLKEAGLAAEVVAVSVGTSSSKDVVRTALAMGADRGVLLEVSGDPEPLAAAKYLAAIIRNEQPDLVLMGKQSTDHDYGQTPGMLAALLNWPQALQASRVQCGEGSIDVTCELDKGTETVRLPLPGVISADLRLNSPRYASMPAIMKAKKKPLDVIEPASLQLPATPQQRLQVVRAEMPTTRRAGRKLSDVASLVKALRDEARVI
jgi:electron transfer flavoprotein beta subunit